MKELCNEHGTHIIPLVPYSPLSNSIAEQLVSVTTSGMLQESGLPPWFWAEAMTTFVYLQNRPPTMANDGQTPYELFNNMILDVGHICTFRCVVHVVLPAETLGKLDELATMGYLLGYKYDSGY